MVSIYPILLIRASHRTGPVLGGKKRPYFLIGEEQIPIARWQKIESVAAATSGTVQSALRA